MKEEIAEGYGVDKGCPRAVLALQRECTWSSGWGLEALSGSFFATPKTEHHPLTLSHNQPYTWVQQLWILQENYAEIQPHTANVLYGAAWEILGKS